MATLPETTTPISTMAGKGVYLDTSGVLAFLDADDEFHDTSVKAWKRVKADGRGFVMTDYVRLECWSLLHRRLGLGAVEDFLSTILPLCRIHAVEEQDFTILARQVLLSRRRDLSVVDLSSFDCMRRNGITHALAFDRHFEEQGFSLP